MDTEKGKLFYVVGASGSGKDSILQSFNENFSQLNKKPTVIAHRYITRMSDSTENAIALSPEEFSLRHKLGLFCLNWQANNLYYGIGIEVTDWLTKGANVIVNGSRGYLPEAKNLFADQLHSIKISVDDSVLEQRLQQRQREDSDEIIQRLIRHQQLKNTLVDSVIINDKTIDDAARQLAQIILRESQECTSNF